MKTTWPVATVAIFFLVSCGKEAGKSPGPSYRYFSQCSNQGASRISSLNVQYARSANKLLVSAFLRQDIYPNSDFFYFTGPLEDGAKLKEPIGHKPDLELKCAEKDCRRFSFSLNSEVLHHFESVKVERFDIAKIVSKRDESVSTRPALAVDEAGHPIGKFRSPEQTWHYSIEKGFSSADSSLVTTCIGNRPMFTLYLSVDEQTSLGPSYYAISGELRGKQYSVDALQNVEGHPIGGGIGSAEFSTDETDSGIKIKTPTSDLQVIVETLRD